MLVALLCRAVRELGCKTGKGGKIREYRALKLSDPRKL